MNNALMTFVCCTCLAGLAAALPAEHEHFPVLEGEFLGQSLPGKRPQLFAPDIISSGFFERDVTMSPDGREMVFGVAIGRQVTLIGSRMIDGVWQEPEILNFAALEEEFMFFEPHISPDGNRLFMLSTKPPEGKSPKPGWGHQNIWMAERQTDGSWGAPQELGPPINTDDSEYYPSLTGKGTLYFTRAFEKENRQIIMRSENVNGRFQTPVQLPAEINGDGRSFNSFISPDESYLIYCKGGEKRGTAEFFISFHLGDDSWSRAINIHSKIDFPDLVASSMYVSPDGQVIFFAGTKNRFANRGEKRKLTLNGLRQMQNSCENGKSDIYWMRADMIEDLKESIHKPFSPKKE